MFGCQNIWLTSLKLKQIFWMWVNCFIFNSGNFTAMNVTKNLNYLVSGSRQNMEMNWTEGTQVFVTGTKWVRTLKQQLQFWMQRVLLYLLLSPATNDVHPARFVAVFNGRRNCWPVDALQSLSLHSAKKHQHIIHETSTKLTSQCYTQLLNQMRGIEEIFFRL
jgi:hypothetical protein